MKNLICCSLLVVLFGGFFHSVKAVDLAIDCSNYTYDQVYSEYNKYLKKYLNANLVFQEASLSYTACLLKTKNIYSRSCADLEIFYNNSFSVLQLFKNKKDKLFKILKICFPYGDNNKPSNVVDSEPSNVVDSELSKEDYKDFLDISNTP